MDDQRIRIPMPDTDATDRGMTQAQRYGKNNAVVLKTTDGLSLHVNIMDWDSRGVIVGHGIMGVRIVPWSAVVYFGYGEE